MHNQMAREFTCVLRWTLINNHQVRGDKYSSSFASKQGNSDMQSALSLELPCRIKSKLLPSVVFPGGSVVKNLPANAENAGLTTESGRFPGEGEWLPTPVFLPGKSHGQRSLAGYSPWGHRRVRHDLVTKQQLSIITDTSYLLSCHIFLYLFKI